MEQSIEQRRFAALELTHSGDEEPPFGRPPFESARLIGDACRSILGRKIRQPIQRSSTLSHSMRSHGSSEGAAAGAIGRLHGA